MNIVPPAIEELLTETFAPGRTLRYHKKELIYRRGDAPSGVYLIRKGTAKVYALNARAEENIIFTFGPGELILLRWGITGLTDDVYIAALSPVEVTQLSRPDFMSAIYERPQLAMRLLEILSGRAGLLVKHIADSDLA